MEVSYLGSRLTPTGLKPGKDKLKTVETAKKSSNKRGNQIVCGIVKLLQNTH
jgi:hypothetical protein